MVAASLLAFLSGCAETLKLQELASNSGVPVEPATSTGLPEVDLETERSANSGLKQIKWSASAFDGSGITVAVVDSGIDMSHEEFAGAIHPDSYNVASSNTDVSDELGHGTNVSGVIGARENYRGLVGVSPNVNLMVLKTDRNGVIFESSISRAFRWADDHGVPITNLSLVSNRDLLGGTIEVIRDAMQRGMLVVGAAGNDGLPEPSWPASFASFEGEGAILAVGSVSANGSISSFSNRAGSAKAMYLVAPGENIVTTSMEGNLSLASGTSVAAPFVSGAAAVLLSKDPHLTGADLAKILLTTAEDLGVAGVDDIYGHGLLDLENALRPVGYTRIVDGSTVASASSSTSQSSASYSSSVNTNGLTAALQDTLVLDSFDRSYAVDPMLGLMPVETSLLDRWAAQPVYGFSPAVARDSLEALDLKFSQSETAAINVSVTGELGSNLQLAAAFGDMSAWQDARDGSAYPAWGRASLNSIDRLQDQSLMVGSQMDLSPHWRAETRFARSLGVGDDLLSGAEQTSLQAGLTYDSPLLDLELSAGVLNENNSLLGSKIEGAFGSYSDEQSQYLAFAGQRALWNGFSLQGQVSLAHSRASNPGGLIASQSALLSSGVDLGLSKQGVFGGTDQVSDRLTFSLSQPLRVLSGQALIDKPVARNLDGQISRAQQLVDLSPEARQLDLSLTYSAFDGDAQAGLDLMAGLSLNPGHIEQSPELSFGLRYKRDF